MHEPINPPADGCGCQYDAGGRRFRTRCICPSPTTPEQTLRGVAGLGGAIGDAVRDLLAVRDGLLRKHAAYDDLRGATEDPIETSIEAAFGEIEELRRQLATAEAMHAQAVQDWAGCRERLAEVEAELEQADHFGRGEFRVTTWAYEQVCAALEKTRAQRAVALAYLDDCDNGMGSVQTAEVRTRLGATDAS